MLAFCHEHRVSSDGRAAGRSLAAVHVRTRRAPRVRLIRGAPVETPQPWAPRADYRRVTPDSTLISAPAAATESRLRFGLVATEYDRVRPGYPDGLIDEVIAYGALEPGDRALDVGAGTGQATIALAERGLSVLALEPRTEMVQIANEKFAATGLDAEAVVGEYETAPLARDSFRLVCAATSWHWLDPEVCFHITARVLETGGTLAVLSTWPLWRRTDLRAELDSVYARSGAPLAEMGPMCPVEPDPAALAGEWMRETTACGGFEAQAGKLASWSMRYSSEGYTALLGTYGDHIGLDPEIRERLFAGVRRTIERAGGSIEVSYTTLLLLARAR
jgi:SAM-dependent methyltransferase